MLAASLVQNFKRKKNWYLWKSVTPSKKTYPYYAKFWFFLGILTLGWLTPITKYWEEFILWDTTTAYPVKMYNNYGVQEWKYVYKVNGYDHFAAFSGGQATKRIQYLDLPEGVQIPKNQQQSHLIQMKYMRVKTVDIPVQERTIEVYFNPQHPESNFYPDTDFMYSDANLFFPVALQIGMIAFFIAVRYK